MKNFTSGSDVNHWWTVETIYALIKDYPISTYREYSEVAQSCPTLCDPVDCSLPGSSVPGIFQATVLEWIAISFSRVSSQPKDRTRVSRIVDRRFTVWATREVQMSDWMYANWNQDCWEKHQ